MPAFHCKLMKNHRTRLFVSSLLLLMLVLILLSAYHYYEDRQQVLQKIDQRLFAGATAMHYTLDSSFHEADFNAGSVAPAAYLPMATTLTRLADDLGLKRLYTLIEQSGKLYVTLSSDNRIQPFFSRYNGVAAAEAKSLKKAGYFTVSAQNNSYRCVFIPCLTANGHKYYVVAEVDVDIVDNALAATFQRALLQCLVLLILSIPLTALFVLPLTCQLYTHALTGLPNRTRLKKDLEACRLPQLMLIDIDGFKDINNYYGVRVGDHLLIRMAEVLRALIPAGTRLYKLDGDEYAVLCEASPRCLSVDYLVTRINEQRIEFEQTEFRLTVTAGVAQGKEQLIEHADLALKEAKRVFTPFKFYSTYLHTVQTSRANLLWTYKLKDAIDSGRMVAYFQPIHNNATGSISHYEALIRLQEEDGTVVSPVFFLEAARRSRVYSQLTLFMLDQALAFIQQHNVYCSVNLLNEDIVVEESRQQIIDRIRRAPKREKLIFEIVESEGIDNYEKIRSFIDQVHIYGIKLAIDDFGTGYSNFDHVTHLDVDYIKIDGSLIDQLGSSARSKTIVKAIINFARELEIETIAEYVSTEALQQVVTAMGINYSQGYLFGKPQIDAVSGDLNSDID